MHLLTTLFTSLLASLCLYTSPIEAHSRSRNPLNYISLIESPRIQTHSGRIHAYSHFDLTFDIHSHAQKIRLSLEPNHDILHEDATIEYLGVDGKVRHTEKIVREDHKVFMGTAFVIEEDGTSSNVGWARVVVRRDGVDPLFEGAFSIMGDHHHIHMKSNYMQTKHVLDPLLEDADDEYMVLYRDSDISTNSFRSELKRGLADRSCASDALSFNRDPNHAVYQGMLKRDDGSWGSMAISNLFEKRQSIDGGGAGQGGNSAGVNLRSTIGSTAGCPTTRKVALIGIATDCTYTADFNSTDSVRANIITQVNTASDLYQAAFNITLGLRNLTVSDAECPGTAPAATPWNVPCSDSVNMENRLNLFSAWRGQRGDDNAFWSLWTMCNTGAEVGLAWLGQLCNSGSTSQQDTSGSSQSVTGANVVARTSQEWQVFAHETGHTFGAVHDCDSSSCTDSNVVNSGQCCPVSANSCDADAQYLMNPFSSPGITQFSPCSVGNICSALGRNSVQSGCLSDNKGVVTITGNQCGNGIVEDGEDCDCGGPEGCAGNACCNPSTCRFNSGMVCDPSNEGCCTAQCQFATAGAICRASNGVCDPQETCSGTNATCPPDTTAPNGQGCGSGLQCASGQCTSRDQQCKTVMGSFTTNNDTYACGSDGCILSCASPDFGGAVCYSMQQNFLDGTTCGGDGRCSNGVCRGASVGGEVKGWIDDNKPLVIGLASAIGGVILLAILGCLIRGCRNKSHRKKGIKRASTLPPGVAGAAMHHGHHHGQGHRSRRRSRGWDGPAVPQDFQQRGYGGSAPPPQQMQEMQSSHQQQQHTSWGYPAPPQPVYGAPPPPQQYSGQGYGGYSASGGPSVRYA